MDPLSKKSLYQISNTPNAIVDAFEAAASSFAVNHHIPGATFYTPTPNQPTVQTKSNKQKSSSPSRPKIDKKSSAQVREGLFEIQLPQSLKPQQPEPENHEPLIPESQPLADTENDAPTIPENSPSDNPQMPIPSNTIIYPPPMLDDSDPDRMRLLHSWYWAGYYTGLADGKKSVESH